MEKTQGRILKGIGGFYYIETQNGIIECKARGLFRNKDLTPTVGDLVEIEYDTVEKKGIINDIKPRKNLLVRPAVSNVDKLYIVCSTTLPQPNFFNIDKLIAIALDNNIEPVIVISKTDLESSDKLRATYQNAGFKVYETNSSSKDGAEEIRKSLSSAVSVFTGNSGVGKSTLINLMFPDFSLKTGEVSLKLSRGKHTTRHVELFPLENCGYLADTPGFSSIDFESSNIIRKENVEDCFPDFSDYLNDCRFLDCKHIGERDCGIKKAVAEGKIEQSRYESYCAMYAEAEKIKDWETKPKRSY